MIAFEPQGCSTLLLELEQVDSLNIVVVCRNLQGNSRSESL